MKPLSQIYIINPTEAALSLVHDKTIDPDLEALNGETKIIPVYTTQDGNLSVFDNAINSRSAVIVCRDVELEPIQQAMTRWFLTTFLTEHRVLCGKGHVSPLFLVGDFSSDIEYLAEYRSTLPFAWTLYQQSVDKGEQPVKPNDSFVYHAKKQLDFFCLSTDDLDKSMEAYLNDCAANQEGKPVEFQAESSIVSPAEFSDKKVNEEFAESFPQAVIFGSKQSLLEKLALGRPTAFVPAAAAGNRWSERLAYYVGKFLVEMGYDFINGGPEPKDGAMRFSALGALLNSDRPLTGVYSKGIFQRFVAKAPSTLNNYSQPGRLNLLLCEQESERINAMLTGNPKTAQDNIVVALPGAIGTNNEIECALQKGCKLVLINPVDEAKADIWGDKSGFWDKYIATLRDVHGQLPKNIAVVDVPCSLEKEELDVIEAGRLPGLWQLDYSMPTECAELEGLILGWAETPSFDPVALHKNLERQCQLFRHSMVDAPTLFRSDAARTAACVNQVEFKV